MCVLIGWLDYKGLVPNKLLTKLTQALANAAEERGTDASGIAYVSNGHMTIYKRPKPAHKLRFHIPEGTRAVMGHTRLTTQGNQKFNYNNHPFLGHADKDFAFAHNGCLYNDEELRKSKKLPWTEIETDSYVAVQLIEQQGTLDFDSLRAMAEDVRGNFTFTALDAENTLYIVKGSSPMYLLHFEDLGLYVYASTESIMLAALTRVGLHKFRCVRIETREGDILSIDRTGHIERSDFECFHTSKYWNWYDYDNYYSTHEQYLLEVCGSFGVDEMDVMMLLDYGYTVDEVEDMLMDSDLINEAIQALKYEDDGYYYNYTDYLCET